MTDTLSPTRTRCQPLQLGAAASRMIAAGLALAAAGIGAGCALGLGSPEWRGVFFHAYLVGFVFYLSITLGALFFVTIHHLCRSGWSVTLRRLAEAIGGNMALMAVLFVPLCWPGELYPWARPEAVADDKLLAMKAGYLNPGAFLARCLGYFAVWGFLAWFLRSRSIRQDASGDAGSPWPWSGSAAPESWP